MTSMFPRLLLRSIAGRFGKRWVAVLAIAIGSGVSAMLLGILAGVGDALAQDFRQVGANIEVRPAEEGVRIEIPGGATVEPVGDSPSIDEKELARLGSIFWRNNLTAYAPLVYGRAGEFPLIGTWFDREVPGWPQSGFRTGLDHVEKSWSLQGRWPRRDEEVAAGTRTGLAVGTTVRIGKSGATVVGIFTSGTEDDRALVGLLPAVQKIAGLEGRIHRIRVSALTTAERNLAVRFHMNPRDLPPAEFERWSCTPYPSTIAYQIEQALRGVRAEPVRRVTQAEAAVLGRVESAVLAMALACIAAAVLGVVAVMTALVAERRREFAILKAMGAGRSRISALVIAEALLLGLLGGGAGALLASLFCAPLSTLVFSTAQPPTLAVILVAWGASISIPAAGIVLPLRRALAVEPAHLLRES